MFLIKTKTIKSHNSRILINNFSKILFFLSIISCSSNGYNTEFPNQNNDEEDQNEFAEIDYGLNQYAITYQGIDRDFSIYIPESYTHYSPSAIIFVFHGFGGNNDMIMYYSGFNSISERENFIVVYPQGSSFWGYPHWNVGGWTNTSSADDIGFVDFLIELISQEYNLNQNRIYATGMSNGGFFSFLLACQLSQKIAAVASVTGSMTNETYQNCNPSKEVPVLQIHGTDDPIVTYNGNSSIGSIGIEPVLSYWKLNNYCGEPTISELTDSNPNDNFYVHRVLFDEGVNGSIVDHYKVYGGEHNWFMQDDINSSELIWSFFSNYDLNGYIN